MKSRTIGVFVAVAALLCFATSAHAASSAKWFGWVSEGGNSHRVCGAAYAVPGQGISNSFYKGWGQTNPNCAAGVGDSVQGSWLGGSVTLYRNGSACSTKPSATGTGTLTQYNRTATCTNPTGSQTWYSTTGHLWWSADGGYYAGGSYQSPTDNG